MAVTYRAESHVKYWDDHVGETLTDHRWEDGPDTLVVRHSVSNRGLVFFQAWRQGEHMLNPGVWLAAPDWVYRAIGRADDLSGVLDWLVELHPGHTLLADMVVRAATARAGGAG